MCVYVRVHVRVCTRGCECVRVCVCCVHGCAWEAFDLRAIAVGLHRYQLLEAPDGRAKRRPRLITANGTPK